MAPTEATLTKWFEDHRAFLWGLSFRVTGSAADADDVSVALDRAMRDASAVLLKGYELPTDQQIVRPGEHFTDKRGAQMWDTVSRLVDRLESKRA